jgi:23S rRNA G2445 N2-methylase RlmL
MFLEQAAQNATTWSRIMQELANFGVEYEQTKENMFETNDCCKLVAKSKK